MSGVNPKNELRIEQTVVKQTNWTMWLNTGLRLNSIVTMVFEKTVINLYKEKVII